jgi:hypothetical protein
VTLALATAAGAQADAPPAPSPGATTAGCPGVIIPMYGDVVRMWRHLIAAPPRATTAIANLGNGPGPSRDPQMAELFAQARAAGIRVIGYVYTNYGKRRLATVKREIDRWERWYPVDGIFVDNLSSDGAGNFDYYRAVSRHIRTWPSNFIVMNGWAIPEYMALTDVVLMFEGPFSEFQGFRLPDWTQTFDASRFANIIYGVPGTDAMRSVFDEATRRNLGTLYVTDRPGRHPYFKFPTFLGSQDAYLQSRGRCTTPPAAAAAPAPQPAMMSAWRPSASAVR